VPPALVAQQVSVSPAVSVLIVVESQPIMEVMADSGSLTLQLTVTSLTYQSLVPRVPTMLGVMTGGVGSTTVKIAATEVAEPHVLLTTTSYEPASVIATEAIVWLLLVAPEMLLPSLRH
jgi:hypothetical protein